MPPATATRCTRYAMTRNGRCAATSARPSSRQPKPKQTKMSGLAFNASDQSMGVTSVTGCYVSYGTVIFFLCWLFLCSCIKQLLTNPTDNSFPMNTILTTKEGAGITQQYDNNTHNHLTQTRNKQTTCMFVLSYYTYQLAVICAWVIEKALPGFFFLVTTAWSRIISYRYLCEYNTVQYRYNM